MLYPAESFSQCSEFKQLSEIDVKDTNTLLELIHSETIAILWIAKSDADVFQAALKLLKRRAHQDDMAVINQATYDHLNSRELNNKSEDSKLKLFTVKGYPGLEGYNVYLDPQGRIFTSQKSFIKQFVGKGGAQKIAVQRFLSEQNVKIGGVQNCTSNQPQSHTQQGLKGGTNGVGSVYKADKPQGIKQIDEDILLELLIHFADPTNAYSDEYANKCQTVLRQMMKTGVRKFHHLLIDYQEPKTYPRGAREADVVQELINLLALSGRNFKFEVPATDGTTYRRFDARDSQCSHHERLYEIKPDMVTATHIKEKLINAHYLAVANQRYQKNGRNGRLKDIELIFVSPNGIEPDANEYIDSITDDNHQVKNVFLADYGVTNERTYLIRYQALSDLAQPIVDAVYDDYITQGKLKAIKHLEEAPDSFLNSVFLPRPTRYNALPAQQQ